MSGNMPNNYFQYDRRFPDQRFQNQRFPDGRPNTFNRFDPFRPFCPPQNGCFPPQFGPQWGNNNCNPCTLKEFEYRDKQDQRAIDFQNKADKRENINKWVTTGALLLGGLIVLPKVLRFMGNTIGSPAVVDGNNTTTTTTRGTTTTTTSTKSPEYFKAEQERYQRELDDAVKAAGDDAAAAKKAQEDYEKKQAALKELQKK